MVFASRDVNILHYFSHRHSLRHCPPAVGGEHRVGQTNRCFHASAQCYVYF